MAGGKESLMDIGVHIDHHVPFDGDLCVPSFNGVLDPFCKIITSNGIGDVDDPLLWQLESFLFLWKELNHLWVADEELAYIL